MLRSTAIALATVVWVGCETGAPLASAPRPAPGALSATADSRDARVRELLSRLAPRLSRSPDGLVKEPIGGGRRRIHLQSRFQHAAIATRGPDGRMRIECASSVEDAERLLRAGAAQGQAR
jgi:hypothetical protein